jgi:hypothetical protein
MKRLILWAVWHLFDKDERRRLMKQIIDRDYPGTIHLHRNPTVKVKA